MTRSERLAQAIRRNAAIAAMPRYLADMSARLGRGVTEADLITLSASEEMRRVVDSCGAVGTSGTKRAAPEQSSTVLVTSDRVVAEESLQQMWATLSPDAMLWLAAEGSELCGAVRVRKDDLIARGLDLARDDEEAVRIAQPRGGVAVRLHADTVAGHAPREWTIYRWRIGPLRSVATAQRDD